jgi:hypothetical protein
MSEQSLVSGDQGDSGAGPGVTPLGDHGLHVAGPQSVPQPGKAVVGSP